MATENIIKLKSKRNAVFRQGNRVVKRFFSCEDYLKESLVYDKLAKTLLAPRVIEKREGCITTEYIEGVSLFDALEGALGKPKEQTNLFNLFFDWYVRFQKTTNFILGDTNFKNFIIKEENLYGVDFETCKEGDPIEDIVWQTAMLATLRPVFTEERKNMARLFLSMSVKALFLPTDGVSQKLVQAFDTICKRRNVQCESNAVQEIASSVEIAACLLAGGKSTRMGTDKRLLMCGTETMLTGAAKNLALFAEKYLSLSANESTIQIDGFEITFDEKVGCGPIGGIVSALAKVRAPWTLFTSCDMPFVNKEMLDYLVRFRREDCDAILFSEAGKRRIFPLLVHTRTALPAFEGSLNNGVFTLWRAMEGKLRVLRLDIEDYPYSTSTSLRNINTKEDYEQLENFQSKD